LALTDGIEAASPAGVAGEPGRYVAAPPGDGVQAAGYEGATAVAVTPPSAPAASVCVGGGGGAIPPSATCIGAAAMPPGIATGVCASTGEK